MNSDQSPAPPPSTPGLRSSSDPDSERRILDLIPAVGALTDRVTGLERGFGEHQAEHRQDAKALDARLGSLAQQIAAVPGLVAIEIRQSERLERDAAQALQQRTDTHSQRIERLAREVAELKTAVKLRTALGRKAAAVGGASVLLAYIAMHAAYNVVSYYLPGLPSLPVLPGM